jgi:hypothetical protein
MTKKERVSRDISLTFDFLRQVVRDPSILDQIPNGSQIEFIEKDFPKDFDQRISKNRKVKFLKKVVSHFVVIA